MVETGSYNVSKSKRKDTSFKSFICALLAFLAMLILISLLLFALRNRGKGVPESEFDSFHKDASRGNISKKENKTERPPPPIRLLDSSTEGPITTTLKEATTSTKDKLILLPKDETSTGAEDTTTLKTSTTTFAAIPDPDESQVTTAAATTTPEGVPVPPVPTGPVVPTTCNDGVCKRSASAMLAIMDHDDKIDRCEDYYKFICDGPESNDERAFFHKSFKGFVKKVKEVTPTSDKYLQLFADFYNSCNQFGSSVNRLDRLKYLKGTEGATLTEAMKTSILTQSLPFFDVGLNMKGDNFILELTLPGLSYLKTGLRYWSLLKTLQDECIEEETNKINQNIIELDKISTGIDTCIGTKATKYITDFVEEIKQLSAFAGFEFLDKSVKDAAQSADLTEIFKTVQEGIVAYRNTNSKKIVEKTVADLKTSYDFGVDWLELLKGITTSTIAETTVIYVSDHLDAVFKKLAEKKANLQSLLDLWYNVELYNNLVIEKEIDNEGHFCLDLVSELMPDVSASIIAELNKDKDALYKETKSLMKDLTVNVYESVKRAGMTGNSAVIIQNRLSEIILTPPQNVEVDAMSYGSVFDPTDPFPKKMLSLLSHYRKTLYSLDQTVITGDPLLKYFINAFATKPKTFPPSRFIVYQPGFLQYINTRLPAYVKIAKVGLPLSEQIARHFTKNDFTKPLEPREISVYEEMEKSFDTKYLMNKIKYTVENIDFEVEDSTGNHLSYDDIFSDNMAFRLETDTFSEDKTLEHLPFLQDYSRAESFLIIALQEYCDKNTLADFVSDYYNRELPSPMKMRNMIKNSDFYSKTFNCTDNFERKQFPYINPSTP